MNKKEPVGFDEEKWQPKTKLGTAVKAKEILSFDEVLESGEKILESEVVDSLIHDLESDLIFVGQSKGKFGGGKKSIWKQTQKKTKEGNKPNFATLAVVGNKDGFIGIGYGKSKETVPAREKAIRTAKLNVIRIRRGCGSWECECKKPHSIPFKVKGKCGSVSIELIPAPKGTSLCTEREVRRILELAGIKDVYSRTRGQTRTKLNLLRACYYALKELQRVKIKQDFVKKAGVIEGRNE